MTRRIVYGVGLWVFLAATALTLTAIALPDWVSYTSQTQTPNPAHPNKPIHVSYGLHKRCSSLTGCADFPQYDDCLGQDRSFCSMWRSVAFIMNLTAVIEFATLAAFAVVLLGGRDKREGGAYKMVSGLILLVAITQLVSMAIVAFLYDHDNRFFVGWKLDRSFVLCTVSWCALLLDAVGIAVAANVLPPEDDYEPIPDQRI